MLGLSQCPLCQLECGSREQLIAHVYQVGDGSKLWDISGLKPQIQKQPEAHGGFVLVFALTELSF